MDQDRTNQLEQQLADQARRLTDFSVDTPTNILLNTHRRRVQTRMILTVVSVAAMLLFSVAIVKPWSSNTQRMSDASNEPTTKPIPSNARTALTSNDDRSLQELLRMVSMKTGVSAELVMVKDSSGVERPAIYVPEHSVAVPFENLNPIEQNAVLRTLNPESQFGSI